MAACNQLNVILPPTVIGVDKNACRYHLACCTKCNTASRSYSQRKYASVENQISQTSYQAKLIHLLC